MTDWKFSQGDKNFDGPGVGYYYIDNHCNIRSVDDENLEWILMDDEYVIFPNCLTLLLWGK